MKKQIEKQLKFACKLLKEISQQHKQGNYLKFGHFALEIQWNECNRLKKLHEKCM